MDTAQRGILAGASFIVTPSTQPAVITLCRRYHAPVISSAFTGEEITAAHAAGADAIKVFPDKHLGPTDIQALATKLTSGLLIPIGGVNLRSAPEFLGYGATAVFVGSSLVDDETWRSRNWSAITTNARRYVRSLPLSTV